MLRKEKLDTPTPEQMAKGGYQRRYVTHVEDNTKAMAHISLHSPVERWLKGGRLSDSQYAAIELVRRLWRLAGLYQKLTATYGERIPGNTEAATHAEIDARRKLHALQDCIPGGAGSGYWMVFEQVCRYDEPAGVAGSRLGYGTRSGAERAHTIVCMVADIIAEEEGLA